MSNKNFNDRKKIYDLWHKEVYEKDVKTFAKKAEKLHSTIIQYLPINISIKKSLLDVACGKGSFLSFIKKKYSNLDLYGTDISEYAISKAKKLVKANFVVSDGENLPYPNDYFDFCTCLGGLEYYQNTLKGAQEIYRILKPKGKAIFFVPNLMFLGYIWLAFLNGSMPTHGGNVNGKIYYDYTDEKFYTYKGWADILQKAGLKITRSVPFNYIGSTSFANRFLLKTYNAILSRFIPFNFSYCFIIVCEKA